MAKKDIEDMIEEGGTEKKVRPHRRIKAKEIPGLVDQLFELVVVRRAPPEVAMNVLKLSPRQFKMLEKKVNEEVVKRLKGDSLVYIGRRVAQYDAMIQECLDSVYGATGNTKAAMVNALRSIVDSERQFREEVGLQPKDRAAVENLLRESKLSVEEAIEKHDKAVEELKRRYPDKYKFLVTTKEGKA